MILRPADDEYDPYYAGYIALAEADVFAQFERQIAEVGRFVTIPGDNATTAPAPGEWSLKEVLIHLSDFERMFAYRALRFSRGDTTPLEAFEQDRYVAAANANARQLESIIREFAALREATLLMLQGMAPEMFERRGKAGGAEVTVRALAHIIAGHAQGHLNDLRKISPTSNRDSSP